MKPERMALRALSTASDAAHARNDELVSRLQKMEAAAADQGRLDHETRRNVERALDVFEAGGVVVDRARPDAFDNAIRSAVMMIAGLSEAKASLVKSCNGYRVETAEAKETLLAAEHRNDTLSISLVMVDQSLFTTTTANPTPQGRVDAIAKLHISAKEACEETAEIDAVLGYLPEELIPEARLARIEALKLNRTQPASIDSLRRVDDLLGISSSGSWVTHEERVKAITDLQSAAGSDTEDRDRTKLRRYEMDTPDAMVFVLGRSVDSHRTEDRSAAFVFEHFANCGEPPVFFPAAGEDGQRYRTVRWHGDIETFTIEAILWPSDTESEVKPPPSSDIELAGEQVEAEGESASSVSKGPIAEPPSDRVELAPYRFPGHLQPTRRAHDGFWEIDAPNGGAWDPSIKAPWVLMQHAPPSRQVPGATVEQLWTNQAHPGAYCAKDAPYSADEGAWNPAFYAVVSTSPWMRVPEKNAPKPLKGRSYKWIWSGRSYTDEGMSRALEILGYPNAIPLDPKESDLVWCYRKDEIEAVPADSEEEA